MSSATAGGGTVEVPAAGDYRIDPHHSTVSFTTRHMFGLAPVRGTFELREGHIHVADPVHDSVARATIPAGSFHTGVSARDKTVHSGQYLDVENHPDITFSSTGVEQVDGSWVLQGSLTVRGRNRPLRVHVEELRPDGAHLRLLASAQVDRYDFGITAMKGMTGRRLTMRLDVRAERVTAADGT
jgi:polyisoprenoid-binding protein YceI